MVRGIEVSGEYDEAETRDIISAMAGSGLEDIDVRVNAVYFSGSRIQLRQTFSATLTAGYTITILEVGSEPVTVTLPIRVKVAGMSEVYWR